LAEYQFVREEQEKEEKGLCLMEGVREYSEVADEGKHLAVRRTLCTLKVHKEEE